MTKPPNFAWITSPKRVRSLAYVMEQLPARHDLRDWDWKQMIERAPNPETRRLMRDKEKEH
jgi:hypothetical protein